MFGRRKENILVIKTDSLTGFVAAEPVFGVIREKHKNAQISLLTIPSLQRIARAAPYFDQVAATPDMRDADARKAFLKQLKSANFSAVYDLSADAKAKKIQGAFGPFGPKWFAAAPVARKTKNPTLEEMLPNAEKLYEAAGVEAPVRTPDFSWALASRKDAANMQPAWFGITGSFGLLAPGMEDTRRWPAKCYGDFARMCAKAGVMPVLVGGKELHEFGDAVSEVAPELVDLTGKTDHLQLAALAREADFFVSDCAEEVHLAVSVGCSGVLIRKAGEERATPDPRHVITLTVQSRFEEATPDFVWQSLSNMGLVPAPKKRKRRKSR
ncbi:MAG: glycosyltransferase family 9 protein [Pseudomonadota bacterium]